MAYLYKCPWPDIAAAYSSGAVREIAQKHNLDSEDTNLLWWLCKGARVYQYYNRNADGGARRRRRKQHFERIATTVSNLRSLLETSDDDFDDISMGMEDIASRMEIPYPDLPVDDPTTHHIKLILSRYPHFMKLLEAAELSARQSARRILPMPKGRPENKGLYEFGCYLADYWEYEAGRQFTADYQNSELISDALVFMHDAVSPFAKVTNSALITTARKIVRERNSQEYIGR